MILKECYLVFAEFELLPEGFYFLVVRQQGQFRLVDGLMGNFELLLQFGRLLTELLAVSLVLPDLVLEASLQFLVRGEQLFNFVLVVLQLDSGLVQLHFYV